MSSNKLIAVYNPIVKNIGSTKGVNSTINIGTIIIPNIINIKLRIIELPLRFELRSRDYKSRVLTD